MVDKKPPRGAQPARNKKPATGAPSERPAWPDRFLTALQNLGTITAAAKMAGISRRTVYNEMDRDPEFKADIQRIKDECVELVESTLFTQAMQATHPAYVFGYLKAHKPEVYADKLNPQQLVEVRKQLRGEILSEIQDELAALPVAARKIVMTAMGEVAKKELNAGGS